MIVLGWAALVLFVVDMFALSHVGRLGVESLILAAIAAVLVLIICRAFGPRREREKHVHEH